VGQRQSQRLEPFTENTEKAKMRAQRKATAIPVARRRERPASGRMDRGVEVADETR